MSADLPELPAGMAGAIRAQLTGNRQFPTPKAIAHKIDPYRLGSGGKMVGTIDTPALNLIDDALVKLWNTPNGRLALSMPPQEGKTTRVVRDFILWVLNRNPDTRIILGTYNQSLANRNGRTVRNIIETHPELGLAIAADNGAKHEWSIAGKDGGVVAAGRGVGISGRPADLVIIDDPFKEGEAQSETIREQAWDWWVEGISARFGADTKVIVVHTRWHQDDFIGRLLERDAHAGWVYLNIPAQCEEPATDPLGREYGEFMVSARGRTRSQWENRKQTAGTRAWQALYQGNPTPGEGGLFKRDWWRKYLTPLWEERGDQLWTQGFDQILISADLTFKGETANSRKTDKIDYVAIGVWARKGIDVYLLDQVHGVLDFVQTVAAFEALAKKWPQAALKLVEDKANGPALISMLAKKVFGIVPVTPSGDKVQRATAWSPLLESGHVWVPDPRVALFNVEWYIEEHAMFPRAKHDDQVDQTSQAIDRLLLRPLIPDNLEEELDDYYDTRIGY